MDNTAPFLAFQSTQIQQQAQNTALQALLQYLAHNSPFYKELFRSQQINWQSVKTVEDLKYLPFTTKEDMQLRNMDFLCVSADQIREYTATSGTMGMPVVVALTENDLNRLANNEYMSFITAAGSKEDIYQLMLTLDRQFMAGMAYYSGIRKMGATVVRTGPGLPSMQWETIRMLGVNAIVAVPSFILKLIDYSKHHQIDLNLTPVKKAICIGESLRKDDFSLNTLGAKIAADWQVQMFSTYASTEMQTAYTECTAGRGGHEQPDLIITEIVDDAGNPLPAGAYGEVVITTLGVEGMPLLRYKTGDICAWYNEPCTCGRHSIRLSPVLGRKQQMIKYKGTTLYPPAIFDMLNQLSFVNEYVVEVFTGPLGTDELKLHLHTSLSADDCEYRLKPVLQSRLRVVPTFHFHSASDMQQLQFPALSRKQIRFIDNREQTFNA